MSDSKENNISLKTINELFGMEFYIPDYQRGYRWKPEQVNNLLDDIWDYAYPSNNRKKGDDEFYCLQPIVVKDNENGKLEVIDGQQRLTTIYLILKTLVHIIDGTKKNIKSITYQTREDSTEYLNSLDKETSEDYIDFHHMYEANKAVLKWFDHKANSQSNAKVKFLTPFLENTKVIWYKINDGSNAKKIFARLNVGKIPLTNAELIKALFLREQNFGLGDKEQVQLKQFRIAGEWDAIENSLQNDSFWYFIFQQKKKEREKNYTTRIEFIFDLIEGKKRDSEKNYTFNKYYEKLNSNQEIEVLWLQVKRYVQTFQNWYQDQELYHLIGFLIAQEFSIDKLKAKSEILEKDKFKGYLIKKIKKEVTCNLEDLEYNHKAVRPVLLLFNIETIISNPNSNIRFPFDSFKKENWDVEHIRSVRDEKPERRDSQLIWTKAILKYTTGSDDIKKQKQFLIDNSLKSAVSEIVKRCIDIVEADSVNTREFNELYDKVMEDYVQTPDFEEMKSIANLTLLDSYTNRMYKNAIFPIKRNTIIKHDKEGTFVPICTKNVFLKYYSNVTDNLLAWEKNDAIDYLSAIKNVLSKYYE